MILKLHNKGGLKIELARLNLALPKNLRDEIKEISDETTISMNQIAVLSLYSFVANYKSKGSFVFADLLNPEHREKKGEK